MRRSLRELPREFGKSDPVAPLERGFADSVLFLVVFGAEADHPGIRRFQGHTAISPARTWAHSIGRSRQPGTLQ